MKLIIGLGNSGEKYKNNRHNVGYMVVDELSKTQKLKNSKQIKIFKSQSFMNDSGSFVVKQIKNLKLKIENLIVIHDDLDLPLGTWKMQVGKGPKDHGGINDIEEKLGTKNFTRIRVGIDNRKPENRVPGDGYVLQDFSDEERKVLAKVIDEICKKLVTTLRNTN